jgi:hypothetical protein
MKIRNAFLMIVLAMCGACVENPPDAPPKAQPEPPADLQRDDPTEIPQPEPALSPKIELDLNKLDKNGLRGRGSGKVLVAYEFCIPNTAKCKAEVKAIDPGVRFMPGSRGRIRAGKDECLCIGETGPNYHSTLTRLAALPYIKRIIECHWE